MTKASWRDGQNQRDATQRMLDQKFRDAREQAKTEAMTWLSRLKGWWRRLLS